MEATMQTLTQIELSRAKEWEAFLQAELEAFGRVTRELIGDEAYARIIQQVNSERHEARQGMIVTGTEYAGRRVLAALLVEEGID
jgi:hypothetical protein